MLRFLMAIVFPGLRLHTYDFCFPASAMRQDFLRCFVGSGCRALAGARYPHLECRAMTAKFNPWDAYEN